MEYTLPRTRSFAPESIGDAAISPLPITIRHHSNARRRRPIVLRTEWAGRSRQNAKDLKVVARDDLGPSPSAMRLQIERGEHRRVTGNVPRTRVLLLQVSVVGIRRIPNATLRLLVKIIDQPIGRRHRQRLKKKRVGKGEYAVLNPMPIGKRGDGHEREAPDCGSTT